MSRGYAVGLLLCLAGAVLLLAGAGATWLTVVVEGRAPLPDVTARVSGADLVPGLRGLGVVGLAAVPALLSVRGWGRVAVGVLLAGTGALAAVLVVRVLADVGAAVSGSGTLMDVGFAAFAAGEGPPLSPWPYAVLLGSLLLAAAGLLVVVRGRAWPALGRRYEAPAARPASALSEGPATAPAAGPSADKDVWEALDRGEDPTR